jgi:hypothetical protein
MGAAMLPWFILGLMCVVTFALAYAPESTARVVIVGVAIVAAFLLLWLISGTPDIRDGAVALLAAKVIIAALCGIVAGRVAWMIKTGESF